LNEKKENWAYGCVQVLGKHNLLKDLAQDCDLLRCQLDEELIAKVSRSEPLVVCALFMRRSGRKLVIP